MCNKHIKIHTQPFKYYQDSFVELCFVSISVKVKPNFIKMIKFLLQKEIYYSNFVYSIILGMIKFDCQFSFRLLNQHLRTPILVFTSNGLLCLTKLIPGSHELIYNRSCKCFVIIILTSFIIVSYLKSDLYARNF